MAVRPCQRFHRPAMDIFAGFKDTGLVAIKAEYPGVVFCMENIKDRLVAGKLLDHIVKLFIILVVDRVGKLTAQFNGKDDADDQQNDADRANPDAAVKDVQPCAVICAELIEILDLRIKVCIDIPSYKNQHYAENNQQNADYTRYV